MTGALITRGYLKRSATEFLRYPRFIFEGFLYKGNE